MIEAMGTRNYLRDDMLIQIVKDEDGAEKEENRHVYLFSDIIVFTKPQKKKKELWKESKQISEVDDVQSLDKGQSLLLIQLKGGIDIVLKYNGMGIRNLWLNELKGAIQLVSQGIGNKVNQNFIFTHKTEQKETKTKKKEIIF